MRKDNFPAAFISFEGGEGAGKTTLIKRCEAQLIASGARVVKTREPGGAKLSEFIRQWLLNRDFNIPVGHQAELLVFLASRAQHIEELIMPALKEGHIVLCDRFNDSTIVYQGIARGLGKEMVQQLCSLVCGIIVPSLTFYLDIQPEIGLQRTEKIHKENASAGEMDRIEGETLSFHRKVREGFLQLAKESPQRIHILDACQSEELVFQQAWSILKQSIQCE
jgi:dTMP kinase